jgi:hypothetical protein
LERVTGFEPRPGTLYPAVWLGRDRIRFAGLHGGGVSARRDGYTRACLRRPDRISGASERAARYRQSEGRERPPVPVEDVFFTAVAPASVGYDARNEHYADERD